MKNIKKLITAKLLIGLSTLNPLSAMDLENDTTLNQPPSTVKPIRCIADEKQHAAMSKLAYNFWALKEISTNFYEENGLPPEIREIIGEFEFQNTEFYFSFPSLYDLKASYEKTSFIKGVFLNKETEKLVTEIHKNGIKFHCIIKCNTINNCNLISLENLKLSEIIFSHGLPFIPRTKNDLERALISYSQKSAPSFNNEMAKAYKTVYYTELGGVSCKYIDNTSDPLSIDITATFFDKNKKLIRNPLKHYSIEMIKTENAKGALNTNYAANLSIPMLYDKYHQYPDGPKVDLNPEDIYFTYRQK